MRFRKSTHARSPTRDHLHGRRRCRGARGLWLCVVLLCGAPLTGCRVLPWQHGPASKSVTTCRELTHQGLAAMQRGDWQQAELMLADAIESCPVDAQARSYYADVLANRGELDLAIAQLEVARDLSAGDPDLIVRTGQMHLRLGQINQAETRAAMALRATPDSADAWALRGRVWLARGDFPRALADLQRALGYRPNDRQLLGELADLYLRLNKPEQALLSLQTLVDTYPTGEEPPDLLHRQGEVLQRLERPEDAAARFAEAARRGGARR
ncbi:MAG: hypothetical protein DWQ46_09790 [Planctomycetota bacterium]|nr:MAG: hypothetical protein DWQ46_09790 [Planctomycetota bacterium]